MTQPKVAILAAGLFTRTTAKTAIGVMRYAPYPVVAVIDPQRAGTDAAEHVGVGAGIPVVATIDEAVARGADTLLIGTAAAGGRIADSYRPFLADALRRGLEVWNGLHERVLDDPKLREAAAGGKGRVRELREPPKDLPVGGHRTPRDGATVVLTVGTDAAVGKMTASLEILAALRRRGQRAAFVATGQTGIAIAGKGISVDAVVADFIAGATERMVVEAAEEADWVIVEGQGSLTHPGFSGVTMGLLHGASPHVMILCHDAARLTMKGYDREGLPVRSLKECIAIYEDAATWRHPPGPGRARVAAVAMNTALLDDEEARAAIRGAEDETGLLVVDPIREGAAGADRLARAIELWARPQRTTAG